MQKFEVFKVRRGWGVAYLEPIRLGDFLCEYMGGIATFQLHPNNKESKLVLSCGPLAIRSSLCILVR